MTTVTCKGDLVTLRGDLPSVGTPAPEFELIGTDLEPFQLADFQDKRVVLNIFPSVDTGVCAMSVRTFNERAAELDDTVVICISRDLPMAQKRFCSGEDIENVVMGSDYRTNFGDTYGVTMTDGPLEGLLSRAVVVIGADGIVKYTEQVTETSDEPDYDAALAALN